MSSNVDRSTSKAISKNPQWALRLGLIQRNIRSPSPPSPPRYFVPSSLSLDLPPTQPSPHPIGSTTVFLSRRTQRREPIAPRCSSFMARWRYDESPKLSETADVCVRNGGCEKKLFVPKEVRGGGERTPTDENSRKVGNADPAIHARTSKNAGGKG